MTSIEEGRTWEQSPIRSQDMDMSHPDKDEEILHRRTEERMSFFRPPIAVDADGRFHYYHHEDATVIELFYDLFFVANLSNLTNFTKINDAGSLSQYIGWFSIIWSTWFQVAIFDVRFGSDSLIYRLFKVVQFCVQMGLASESANFIPRQFNGGGYNAIVSFRIINYILLISRAALICEYLVPSWYFLRKGQKDLALPLLLCCATFLVSTIIYAGLIPTFSNNRFLSHAYRAWYVILAFEVLAIIAISSVWRVVSFKHTHVVKRMGLLTLIILGEGILNIGKQASEIAKREGWSARAFGQTLTVVLIIVRIAPFVNGILLTTKYFIWDLYFGKVTQKHFGMLKQQVLTLLHYPFHLALALVLEGQVLWASIEDIRYKANHLFSEASRILNSEDPVAIQLPKLNASLQAIAQEVQYSSFYPIQELNSYINNSLSAAKSGDDQDFADNLNIFSSLIYNALLKQANLNPSDTVLNKISAGSLQANNLTLGVLTSEAYNSLFGVSYVYYLVCAGSILILLGGFRWLMLLNKDRFDFICIAIRLIMGSLLCFLSLFLLQASGELVDEYTQSGMFLPTFLLTLIFIAIMDRCLDSIGLRRYYRKFL